MYFIDNVTIQIVTCVYVTCPTIFRCSRPRRAHGGKQTKILVLSPVVGVEPIWRTIRGRGIKPRRDTQLKVPEVQRAICSAHIWSKVGPWFVRTWLGPITLMTRSTWPTGQLRTRHGLATQSGGEVASLIDFKMSLRNSRPFPFLLSSRRLEEQVMTFLILRLSPAEAIKITASSSKSVRSLIIPPRIFPALTGSRVWRSCRLSTVGGVWYKD